MYKGKQYKHTVNIVLIKSEKAMVITQLLMLLLILCLLCDVTHLNFL